jgi:hypothetical protein
LLHVPAHVPFIGLGDDGGRMGGDSPSPCVAGTAEMCSADGIARISLIDPLTESTDAR